MFIKHIFRATAILFLFFINLYSQNGNILGVVKEAASGDALPGANVFIVGTSTGAATDIQGRFTIRNIDPGVYLLKAKYIGYDEKEDSITILSGKTTYIEFNLKPSSIETEVVTISAQAKGQAEAINQQLSSNTIVNIVSEEKIQELPDANAAESIGRLPGVAIQREGGEASKVVVRGLQPSFTSVTIDGIRIAATELDNRGVDLSMISQNSLAGIELYKALTSDQDADAIAGNVNLVTQVAPNKRKIRFDGYGGYNKLDNSFNQYNFLFKYGERFFNNILGVQLNGNLEQRVRSTEVSNTSWNLTLDNFTDYKLTNLILDYTNELRNRNGLSLLLDINTPDDGLIKINSSYNKTERNSTLYNRDYPFSSSEGSVRYGIRDIENALEAFNGSIIGDNYLSWFDIKWGFSFNQSTSENLFDYQMTFVEPTAAEGDSVTQGMRNVPQELKHGPAEDLIPLAVNNFDMATLEWAHYRGQKNIQIEKTVFLNLLKQYFISNYVSGEIKLGGKYKLMNRSRNSSHLSAEYYNINFPQYEDLPDGSIGMKDFNGTSFENLQFVSSLVGMSNFYGSEIENRMLFDIYNLTPELDVNLLREWYELNKNGRRGATSSSRSEYNNNGAEPLNTYNIVERISSAYIMNTLNIGSIASLIIGLRVENEHNTYNSKYTNTNVNGIYFNPDFVMDTVSTYNETIWLPNIQTIIRPVNFMNIRLAAYKALSRPNFNNRLIKYIPNTDNITLANPNLKAAKAWNYEISTSFFSNYIGLITLSAYYKVIEDMYHSTNGMNIMQKWGGDKIIEELGVDWPIPNANYNLIYYYNSPKDTKVWGFELEQQINFLFLPGFLKGFVLSYNFSINRSETYLYETETIKNTDVFPAQFINKLVIVKTKLENQPELMANIALGYDIADFSIRMSVFFQDKYKIYSSADGRQYTYVNPFTKWDLSIKQKITSYLSILFNLNNFTDYYEGTTKYSNDFYRDFDRSRNKYGLSADLGIRVEL